LKEKMIINVISALGGAERTLYAGTDGFRGMCGTMDWSPNGKWLAFGESNDKGFHSRIALLSLDDLTVKELTSPVAQEYDCEPAFSPDGSSVTFERGSLGGFGKDLFVIPVASGKLRRLTFDNAWGGTPAWTQDGTEILFSSNRGGLLSLWRVSATGGSAKMIPKITTSCW
jgi:TolB protein